MVDSTAVVNVDLILKPGKVLGKDEMKQLLVRAVAAIKLPPTVVKANIKIDDDIATVRNKISGMSAQINRAIKDGVQSDGKVLQGATKDQFLAAKQSIKQIDELYGRQESVNNRRFNNPNFRRVYEAFSRGEIRDDKTGRVHKVNTGELENLRKVKGLGKLFPVGIEKQVAKYNSELERLLALLRQIDTTSGRTKAGTEGKKTPPSYLSAEADNVKESVARVKKNLQSEETVRELQDKANADRKKTYDKQEKRLADARDRATARRENEARQAQVRQQKFTRDYARQEKQLANARQRTATRIAKEDEARQARQVKAASAGRGRKERLRFGRGETLGFQNLKNAAGSANGEIAKTQALIDKLSKKDTKKYQADIDRLTNKITRLNAEVVRLNKASSAINRQIGTGPLIKKGLTPAQAQQRVQNRNAIIEGRRAFDRSGGFGGSFSASAKELGALASFHKAKVDQIRRVQSKLDVNTAKGAASYDRLGKALFRHGRDLEATTQHMRTFGGATQQTAALFRQFFRYAIGYGALYQALAAIRALISGVVELDKALKSIQAVTQATNKELALIETGIKGVATETQFNTKEIAEAALILGQAGVIPTELPAAIRATALFASATGSAIQLSADLVTSMRNVFSTVGDQTIANQLTQAINISKLTAADLKTIISLSSQISKSYGLATQQYLAAATTLRNAGLKPSTVATGLRQGLIELFSPDSKTIKALQFRYSQIGEALSTDAIKDKFFGFSLTDSPLITALRELQRLGFTGEGKKVFQRAYDVRAENAISALINNIDELEGAASKLTFGEAAVSAAQTQMESLANSYANTKAAISVLAHDLSGPLLTGLESFADTVTDIVKGLTEANLQMKVLSGHGLGPALGAGVAGAFAGGTYFKGGIPGKIVAGAAAATAAFNISKDTTLEAETRDAAGNAVQRFFKDIGAIGSGVLSVAIPLLAVEMANLVRGKGSPALTGAFGKIFRKARGLRGAPARESLLRRPLPAQTARSVAQGVKGSAAVHTAIASVAAFFGLDIFKKLASVAKFAFKIVKRNPIILAVTTLLALAQLAAKLGDAKTKKNVDARLKDATEAAERVKQAGQPLRDTLDEFTLGTKGKAAKEGTTAASIDKLGKNISDYEVSIAKYFGADTKNVEEITNKLSEFGRYSPEAGSTEQKQAYAKLLAALDLPIGGETTAEITSRVANQSNALISQAEALRVSTAGYIDRVREQGEKASDSAKIMLQAFDEAVGGSLENQALFYGLTTGDAPLARAKKVQELLVKLANRTKELVEGSDAALEQTASEAAATTTQIKSLIDKLAASGSREEMQEILREYLKQYFNFTDEAAAGLTLQIEDLKKQRDELAAQISSRLKLSTDLEELKNAEPAITRGGRRKTQNRIRRIETAIETGEPVEDLQRKLSVAVTGVQEFKATEREVRAGNREQSAIQVAEFRRELAALLTEFGPGATAKNIGHIENAFPVGTPEAPGEDRIVYEKLIKLAGSADLLRARLEEWTGADKKTRIPAEFIKLFDDVDRLRKNIAKKSAEFEKSFIPTIKENNEILDASSAITRAKKAKSFDRLTTREADPETGESKNLYKILEGLKVAQYNREINQLRGQLILGDKEQDDRDKRINTLQRKITEENHKAENAIFAARIDSAKEDLKQFKAINRRKLTGYKTQLARAVDGGDILEAYRIDGLILGIKKQQLALEIKRLEALGAADIAAIEGGVGTTEEKALAVAKARADNALAIANFKADAGADLIPELSKPAVIKRVGAQIVSRLDRDVPAEAELSDDALQRGRLEEQGKVTSAEARNKQRLERIAANSAEISKISSLLGPLIAESKVEGPHLPGEAEKIAAHQETINRLREQIGKLQEEATAESGVLALGPQLTQGFDLGNVSNQLDASSSSISNLGKTIQNDLVQGLDDAAGGFATALASGQKFTDGLKASFSAMLRQIAADIIKSGVIKLASLALGGATGGIGNFFKNLFAKGGVVEAKAAGGEVGGGGQIRGPGTGTSDSVPGVVINSKGQAIRGIRVSNGEGIVTAKAVRALGASFLRKVNTASSNTLRAIRQGKESVGFAKGGVPSGLSGLSSVISNATNVAAMRPMQFAAGGVVYDSGKAVKESKTGASTTVDHNFSASVTVEADEDTGVDQGSLRQFDDGLTIKIQEYVQDQLRPGGLLQGARSN